MSLIIPTQASENAVVPKQTTSGAAAADLVATHDILIPIGDIALVKTGLKMAIPDGYAGLVCSRSGLALKSGVFVLNAPGVVDADYRGDVGVILHNVGKHAFQVKAGDRVAQLMIVKVQDVYFDTSAPLDATERGEGGFGSTGVSEGFRTMEARGDENLMPSV